MSVAALLAFDASPRLLANRAHDYVAALSLVLIALAYVVYQAVQRAPPKDWAKTLLLALAFLFWAANQLSSDREAALLFNDVAIAAFVLDVIFVIVGRPPEARHRSGADRPTSSLGVSAP
jgi:cbb3-type cytochrome oxidase subunit 3